MPSWNELLQEFVSIASTEEKDAWLNTRPRQALEEVGRLRGGRHVLLYGSAFLQKPLAPGSTLSITHEDLNGIMAVIFGMDWKKGLTLLLHSPGGVPNAAETIVDYLRSKFDDVEVIVPAFAMSAGSMISLSANRIVMGRQSQLGPFDPQMGLGGRMVSARAIVEQFERGRDEILHNVAAAHAWAPILQSMGPALLVESQNALDYGEKMVAGWLKKYMFGDDPAASPNCDAIARHFNDASTHKSHGRRINFEEALGQGLLVEKLEDSQELQEEVLTAYHLMTILFEQSPAAKIMLTDTGRNWIKSWISPQDQEILRAQRSGEPGPGATPKEMPSGPNRADRRRQERKNNARR